MSVTIIEALLNAKYNLNNVEKNPILLLLAKEQLNNAATLLERGYDTWDEVEPLLKKYGSVDDVPEKDGER